MVWICKGALKYDIVGEEDKHMVELEHFNQKRAAQ